MVFSALLFQHFREHLDKLFAKGIGMLDIALNEAFNILSDVSTSLTCLLRLRTIDGICRKSWTVLVLVLRYSESNRHRPECHLHLDQRVSSCHFECEQIKGQGDDSLSTTHTLYVVDN